jgi:D-alanine-D-alanine ligase
MKRIIILYGGKSGEHEVSRLSAASVVRNLDPSLFEAVLVGVARSGSWTLQDPALAVEARKGLASLPIADGPAVFAAPSGGLFARKGEGIEALPCDAVFPVLHGTFGEDGTIQGLLETAGLPYVGAPVLGSALGMDKEKAKALWKGRGLPVLPWLTARRRDLSPEAMKAIIEGVGRELGWPAFVKPVCAGSSVGAAKADNAEDLPSVLAAALEWDERALIEPFCAAREIECAVLGNTGAERGAGGEGAVIAFAPGEVVPSHEFYDYDAKYLDPNGARFDLPARIPEAVAGRVRALAVEAYEALELAGMARVDFFLDRKSGELYLNEVNTIPGFTSISMYPKMCEAAGLRYADLLTRLVDLALRRSAAREGLRFAR